MKNRRKRKEKMVGKKALAVWICLNLLISVISVITVTPAVESRKISVEDLENLGGISMSASEGTEITKENIIENKNAPEESVYQFFPDQETFSEGLEIIKADKLQSLGYSGENTTIAIIDTGFQGYETNTEITKENIIEIISFRNDDKKDVSKHGTAITEQILGIVPDAKCYLIAIETGENLEKAVDYAIKKRVDIIHMSGSFFIGPHDGTGYICEIVNKAEENGIFFVNSAGNYAKKHWQGIFSDTDRDGFNEFNENPIVEKLRIGDNITNGTPIEITLTWDDWTKAENDYDMYLINSSGWIFGVSENYQNETKLPVETIKGIVNSEKTSDTYYILIRKYKADRDDVHLELYSYYQEIEPRFQVPESSLSIPADSSKVIAVGAVDSNDIIEPFSSRGPTNDGRIKPDFVAPNRVSTNTYGKTNGIGTSFAAPYVTGGLALILEILESTNTSMSINEIKELLEKSSKDLGKTGKDNIYGAGRIDLERAYEILCLPAMPPWAPSWASSGSDWAPSWASSQPSDSPDWWTNNDTRNMPDWAPSWASSQPSDTNNTPNSDTMPDWAPSWASNSTNSQPSDTPGWWNQ